MSVTTRRRRRTENLAYPIFEAKARIDEGLMPWEEWDGTCSGVAIPKWIDRHQLDDLAIEFWEPDENGMFGDLVYEALERCAFALGLEWSNERQRFVPITGAGSFRQDPESGEWEAI